MKAALYLHELNMLVMKKIIFITLILLGKGLVLNGQQQNNLWYFGTALTGPPWNTTSFGLDFSGGGSPVQVNNQSALSYYESVSVASDENGILQFYSNGIEIMDASHQRMSGAPAALQGSQQGTTASSVQGAYHLKIPDSDDKFLLFTTGAEDGVGTGLRYSEIDLSLPGNGTSAAPLGEVTSFDNLLEGSSGEMMTSYGSCGSDTVWIIAHQEASINFTRVLVTKDGVQSTVSDPVPMLNGGSSSDVSNAGSLRGSMDINIDGTKLIFTAQSPAGTFILDFNSQTGALSNPIKILNPAGITFFGYGSEFSPDGKFAYFAHHQVAGLFQYDVLNKTSSWVTPSNIHAEIITGPDDILYIGKPTNPGSMTLAVIEFPNVDVNSGSVGYNLNAIDFSSAAGIQRTVSYAMPQGFTCSVTSDCVIDAVGAQCDTTASFQLTATPSGGVWSGGDYITAGGIFDPSAAGPEDHWVVYDAGCDEPDSLKITVSTCCPNINPDLGADMVICADQTVSLDAGSGFSTYEWKENGVIIVGETGYTISADSGTYIVNVTDGNSCTGTDTIEIENYDISIDLGPDTSYCIGGSFLLDAGAFNSWAWTPNGKTTQKITVTAEGTYRVTVTDANGCEATDEVLISEWDLPTPTITGNKTVCEGSSTQITGASESGGTLNWSGITIFTNPLSITTGGTYTLIETDTNGCIDSVDHVVTAEDLPTVDLGGPYTFCFSFGNQTLDASTGGANETYLWSDASTAATLDVTDSSIVSVIVTSENGCMAYDTAIIDTFSLPKVELGNDASYCKASSIVLDAGAFDSWAWTPNGKTTQKITVTAEGTYGVTVTDTNGCKNTDSIIITEKQLPTIDLGSDTTVCEADSISLDATHNDAVSYSWTPNSENTSTIKVGSADGTFGVTITDNNGCVFTASITISQEDLPIVNLGLNDTICDDLKKTLNAGAGVEQSYTWYLNDAVIENETAQTFAADSGTYIVSVKTPFGCETKDTIEIDNYQLPVVIIPSSYEFCELDSVNLDAGNPTATFKWIPGNKTDQTIWANSDTTYTVTVTDTNGCINEGRSLVSENPAPVPGLGPNSAACIGLETRLDATVPNGVTYIWSTISTAGIHDEANYSFTGPDTVSIIVTDSKGCIGYDTLEIKSLDSLKIQFGDTALECENDIQALDPGDFQGASYTWTLPNGITDSNQSIVPNEIGWYVINVIDQFNCKGLDSIYVVIIPLPNIKLGPDTMFCSYGQEVYTIRMEFDQKVTGTIDWNDGGDNYNSNDTLFSATYAPSTVIGQFIDDSTGCMHRDSVELTEFCEPTIIVLPNIFTPGGTMNTTFHPIGLDDDTYVNIVNNIVSSEFEVYNRWGLKVYQSENLLPRWNGVYENRPVASGTYFWIYKYKDSSLKEYKMNGFVQVIQMM
jgi:hypothetical protein